VHRENGGRKEARFRLLISGEGGGKRGESGEVRGIGKKKWTACFEKKHRRPSVPCRRGEDNTAGREDLDGEEGKE